MIKTWQLLFCFHYSWLNVICYFFFYKQNQLVLSLSICLTNKPALFSEDSGTSGSSSEGTSGSSTSPWEEDEEEEESAENQSVYYQLQMQVSRLRWRGTWVMASSSASTASSSSGDSEPASISSICYTDPETTVTETTWKALRSLMVPWLTLWYSMASWVSSIMRSTSSIDITWKGVGHPAHK